METDGTLVSFYLSFLCFAATDCWNLKQCLFYPVIVLKPIWMALGQTSANTCWFILREFRKQHTISLSEHISLNITSLPLKILNLIIIAFNFHPSKEYSCLEIDPELYYFLSGCEGKSYRGKGEDAQLWIAWEQIRSREAEAGEWMQ